VVKIETVSVEVLDGELPQPPRLLFVLTKLSSTRNILHLRDSSRSKRSLPTIEGTGFREGPTIPGGAAQSGGV